MGEEARRFWTLHIDTPGTDIARLRTCWQLIQPDADVRPGWLKLVVKRRRSYRSGVGLLAVFLVAGTFAVTVLSPVRSEEHTSELQSLMRISYAVFCLNKKKKHKRLLASRL